LSVVYGILLLQRKPKLKPSTGPHAARGLDIAALNRLDEMSTAESRVQFSHLFIHMPSIFFFVLWYCIAFWLFYCLSCYNGLLYSFTTAGYLYVFIYLQLVQSCLKHPANTTATVPEIHWLELALLHFP